jgi:hypothetical protein
VYVTNRNTKGNDMPSWKKVITSGSDASLNSLYAPSITGSLLGTASFAITASYALTASFSQATTENRILVMNKSGATITKGMVVHLTGSNNSSDTPYVVTASYESDSLSANTLGIAYQTITTNNTGYVVTEGVLTGIDVTGYISGQVLYLGATGSIIGTAPTAPLHSVRLGQVVRDSPLNNGSIYVRIDNGYELGELHDVADTTTTASYGDLLVKSGSVWINSKQLTGSYAITGSLTATSFTGSLFGTASYAIQAGNASTIDINVFGSPVESYLLMSNVVATTGVAIGGDADLRYNSSTNTLTAVNISATSLTGSLLGTASYATQTLSSSFASTATSASYALNATTATTASYVLNAVSASFASTASFVNTLNQNVLITGSLTVGATSIGVSENTLTLGPRDNGSEGGQLMLQAPGGTYTSASMWDNYANQTRLLRGSNAGSDALVASFNMHTKQMQLAAYNNVSAFPGSAAAFLAVDSSGNLITTSSAGGGGSVTINNNVDNYVITGTGTLNTLNGESNLQFNGSSLSVTGQITSSGAIISQANGAMYFRGGDDAEFWDINVANTVGIYGQQNADRAGLKLGSSGATLFGTGSRFGIGTIAPVATLDVNGNLYVASGITGSLLGTASFATQALSASYAPSTPAFPYTGSAEITGSLGVTGSFSVLDSIDAANKILIGSGPIPGSTEDSVNWDSRTLLDSNGNFSVRWGALRTMFDASQVDSINWDVRRLISTNTSRSIDWENRFLHDSSGNITVDWTSTALYDVSAKNALNWDARDAYDSAEVLAINWDARRLTDSSAVAAVRWDLRSAYDTVDSQSIDWGSRLLKIDNGPGAYTVNWNAGILRDTNSKNSVDWQNRQLKNNNGDEILNWQSGVKITGSAIVSGSFESTGSFKVYGAGTGFAGPFAAIEVDDANFSRKLYDYSAGSASIDFGNRNLLTANGAPAISWDGSVGIYTTNLYNSQTIDSATRGNLYGFNVQGGQTLAESYFDIAVMDNDLVYLNTDGQWYQVDQTTNSSTKMLGIAKSVFSQTGSVLIEGDIVVTTGTGYPAVANAGYGLPVYIKQGAGTAMDTTAPVSGYVRLLGHCYYTPYAGSTEWIMKFRPSNEWIEL